MSCAQHIVVSSWAESIRWIFEGCTLAKYATLLLTMSTGYKPAYQSGVADRRFDGCNRRHILPLWLQLWAPSISRHASCFTVLLHRTSSEPLFVSASQQWTAITDLTCPSDHRQRSWDGPSWSSNSRASLHTRNRRFIRTCVSDNGGAQLGLVACNTHHGLRFATRWRNSPRRC